MMLGWKSAHKADHFRPKIEGCGHYVNEHGDPSLSGHVIVHKWKNTKASAIQKWPFFLICTPMVGLIIFKIWPAWTHRLKVEHYISLNDFVKSNADLLMPSLFPILTIFMYYLLLTEWINKSRFELSGQTLKIDRGPFPLPWIKGRSSHNWTNFIKTDIQIHETKLGNVFRLVAITKDSYEKVIEEGFQHYSDARILEQWLEKKLGKEITAKDHDHETLMP